MSHFILDDKCHRAGGPALRGGGEGSDCASLKRLTHFALYNAQLDAAPLCSPTVTYVAIYGSEVSSSVWERLFERLPNLQTLITFASLPRPYIYEHLPASVENVHCVETSLNEWTDAALRAHRLPSNLPRLANFSLIVAVDQPRDADRQTCKFNLLRESLKCDTIPPGCRVKYELRVADVDDVFDELMLEYGF